MPTQLLAVALLQIGSSLHGTRPPAAGPEATTPNVVLIVVDDFGVDLMPAYEEGEDLPCTPTLDSLAASGMLFRNAWASPQCSPARAQLMTGRYGFRTGIGTPAGVDLSFSERIVPEMLGGYDSTAVGKWHLGGGRMGTTHPNDSGFAHFAGSTGNLNDYSNWTKLKDGVMSSTMTYATTDAADEAIGAIRTMQEPFFLYVSFHAPHGPAHVPDSSLLCPAGDEGTTITENSENWEMTRVMVSAMDTELGRVLAVLNEVDPDAYVFFIGDNGTGGQATRPPFITRRAKGTVYEGGINVPLVVRGPGVAAGTECAGLVSAVDLFATFAELSGMPSAAEDSVSLVPYFGDPDLSLRTTVYSEAFSPNHQASLPFSNHERAIRDARYKLIRVTNEPDEFYDLWIDPWESIDLAPFLVPGTVEEQAYQALVAELVALGVD